MGDNDTLSTTKPFWFPLSLIPFALWLIIKWILNYVFLCISISESIELHSFTVGENTPFIKYMKVYECSDNNKKPLSWLNISSPPPGLALSQNYQIVLEADVALHAEDFKMVFRTRLGGKWWDYNFALYVITKLRRNIFSTQRRKHSWSRYFKCSSLSMASTSRARFIRTRLIRSST